MLKALLVSALFLMHPVHVTLTSIDFDPEQGGYSVFIRMYFDDFMTDSRMIGNVLKETDFKAANQESKAEAGKYIGMKLQVRVNGRLLAGKVSELQVSENEISMNLIYEGGKKPGTILVKNMLMTTLYADMSNMVIVRVADYEEGVKLTSDLTEQTFKIK
jgi:hypothetical protein